MGVIRKYNNQTAQWEAIAVGETGFTGSSGSAGFTGSAGVTGFTGSSGIGFTGSAGAGSTGGNFTASNSSPTISSVGDYWFRPSVNTLYQYVNNGSYTFWLDISGPEYNFGIGQDDITLLNDSTIPNGQAEFTTAGTYSWTAPTYVTKVCVVCVGGGQGGSPNDFSGSTGGRGAGLGWKNNITVVPGQSYTVVVGAGGAAGQNQNANPGSGGDSYFISLATVAGRSGGNGGTYIGDGGGNGGSASGPGSIGGAGGGAGGYTGNGGNGGNGGSGTAGSGGGGGGGGGRSSSNQSAGSGGGVGIFGQGANGTAGTLNSTGGAGSGGSGENYGGGGGTFTGISSASGFFGGGGAVRIIWGAGRAFPSTLTANI